MEKLKYIKPKLFSTMKTYTKEQFVKDIVAGIIVAIIALPLSIALAIASCQSGAGSVHSHHRRILHLPARWQPRADRRSYRSIRCYHLRHHRPIWHDRTYNRYFLSGIIMIIMGLCHFGNLIKFIPKTITVG